MSEMRERVAKAVAKKLDMEDVDFTQTARAAIAAMREPTEEMIEAGNEMEGYEGNILGIWQAMIDEALK